MCVCVCVCVLFKEIVLSGSCIKSLHIKFVPFKLKWQNTAFKGIVYSVDFISVPNYNACEGKGGFPTYWIV